MLRRQPQIILGVCGSCGVECRGRGTSSTRRRRLFSEPTLKIVVADDLPASALDVLRAEGWDVDARTGRTAHQLASDLAPADALVVRSATKVTSALIGAAPRLRVIARGGTGVDNVDVAAATAPGIVVINAPGA